jgi:hypothetical protein
MSEHDKKYADSFCYVNCAIAGRHDKWAGMEWMWQVRNILNLLAQTRCCLQIRVAGTGSRKKYVRNCWKAVVTASPKSIGSESIDPKWSDRSALFLTINGV